MWSITINSSNLSLFLRWVGWVLSLAGAAFVLLAVMIVIGRKWSESHKTSRFARELFIDWKIISILTEPHGVSRTMSLLVTAIAMFLLGYAYRATETYDRVVTLYDVGVVKRYDDFTYDLHYKAKFGWGDHTENFCRSYGPPFRAGEKLKYLTYIDRISCWDISDEQLTGYEWYKQDGKAILFAEFKP
jgi:hypothetical protein